MEKVQGEGVVIEWHVEGETIQYHIRGQGITEEYATYRGQANDMLRMLLDPMGLAVNSEGKIVTNIQ